MRILADENITQVREYFAPYGEVLTVAGRSITAANVRDCDALLVRSVTPVTAGLLRDSRCRFVATATSGIDHIDVAGLASAGIALGWARGCNAVSVVDYVFSVLASISDDSGDDWRHWSVGIIGCGEIGSRLAGRLLQLGMTVQIHDPLLPRSHPLAFCFAPMERVLQQQVVTLHVPLTRDGGFPTWHLLARRQLDLIPPTSLFINAARGAAVDNSALLQWLDDRPQQRVVLDTWEHEPTISLELLSRVKLGTPHIAGYSFEGKLTGTRMILRDFCRHFSLPESVTTESTCVPLAVPVEGTESTRLNGLIRQAYDVRRDHRAMLSLLQSSDPPGDFDALRKHYPQRHEFSHYRIDAGALPPAIAAVAAILGFRVQS